MAKDFFKLLKNKFSRRTNVIPDDSPSTLVTAEPDDLANDDYVIEVSYREDISGLAENRGDNILMPDIYADNHDDTELNLSVLDQPSPDFDEPEEFNPYDTAVLQKKTDFKPR